MPVDSCTLIIVGFGNQPLESKCFTWVPLSFTEIGDEWFVTGVSLLIQTYLSASDTAYLEATGGGGRKLSAS